MKPLSLEKDGKLYEITGMPACGKTALLKQAAREIAPEVKIFSGKLMKKCLGIPDWIVSDKSIFLKFLLFVYACQNFRIFSTTYKITFKIICRMEYSLLMKAYIYFNIYKKIGRFNFVKKHLSQFHVVVDEGLSHIPFNLTDFHSKKITSIEKVYIPLKEQLKNIHLIVLDSTHLDIEQRLCRRGHRRFDREKAHLFVEINRNIENGIASFGKKYFKHCSVLDASRTDLLGKFIKTLK